MFMNKFGLDNAPGAVDEESEDGVGVDGERGMSETEMMDWGLCPHGVTDDGDCDQCVGGPSGWDGVGPDW